MLTLAVASTLVGSMVSLREAASTSSANGAVMVSGGSNAEPAAARPARDGLERLVFYGHSIPSGVGASRVTGGYADLAASATGLRLVNHAYGGTGAVRAARILAASPPAEPGDVVVIHTGLNDVFRRGAEATTRGRVAIRSMLARTTEAGRRVLVLECQPVSWSHTPPATDLQTAYESWNAMIRDIATFWRDVEVLDTCAEWPAQRYTDESGYHPNDAGHALLARELAALL